MVNLKKNLLWNRSILCQKCTEWVPSVYKTTGCQHLCQKYKWWLASASDLHLVSKCRTPSSTEDTASYMQCAPPSMTTSFAKSARSVSCRSARKGGRKWEVVVISILDVSQLLPVSCWTLSTITADELDYSQQHRYRYLHGPDRTWCKLLTYSKQEEQEDKNVKWVWLRWWGRRRQ